MLSLYLIAAPGLGRRIDGLAAFLFIILTAWGCGAWFWGRAVDGESSMAPRLLAFTQGMAALYSLLWPWLLPFSAWLRALWVGWTGTEPDLIPLLGQALALAPLAALPAFFSGGALPLLAEMALKKRRQLEWNLPLIGGCRLAGLAAGFAAAAFAPFQQHHILWSALAAAILIAALIPLTDDKADSDEYEGAGGTRLWPSRSLGLWTGEAINVLDHDLTKSAARPAWRVTFLCSLAISGSVSFWAVNFCDVLSKSFYDVNWWWVYVPGAIALGGLILAPQLARQGSPSTVLALAAALAALGLGLAPWFLGHIAAIQHKFWAYAWPCAVLGTLWPLAGQVFQARRHWLASSLGLASFWISWGAAAGIILSVTLGTDFYRVTWLYMLAALSAAFVALTPLVGRFLALILWIIATAVALLLYFL